MLRYILIVALCGCSQAPTITTEDADAILYRATLEQRDAILRGEATPCCRDLPLRRSASAPVKN